MVIVNDKAITRRGLIRGGAFCAFGLMASSLVCPRTGFAFQQSCDPVVRVEIRRGEKGAAAGLFESRLFAPRCQSSDKTGISIQSSSLSRGGSVELYSGVCSIPLSLGGYEVQEKESDDALEVYVKMSLGVLWGDNKNSVQIQRGSFLVEQKSPFLNYSDIAYAMMQKDRFISDMFNGQLKTVETGWPSVSFDSSTDIYTCGGAVTGSGLNFMTGEEFWFTVELYLQ